MSRARAIIEAESPKSVLRRVTVENPDIEAAGAVRVKLYADGVPNHSYVISEPAFRAWRHHGLKGTKTQLAQHSMNNEIRRLSKEEPYRHVRLWTGELEPLAEAETPKEVFKQFSSSTGTVAITVKDPLKRQTIDVPVRWYRDMVSVGGGTLPGVVLRHEDTPGPPQGMTLAQWQYLLEVVEYAFNEGPVIADDRPPDFDDVGREEDMWLPHFSYKFVGGQKAYSYAMNHAESNAAHWTERQ